MFFKILFLFYSIPLVGQPLLVQKERLEVDWTKLKVRFYGEWNESKQKEWLASNPPPRELQNSWEKSAMSEGLLYARDTLASYHKEVLGRISSKDTALAAADAAMKATYVLRTEYEEGGGVRVYMECSLAQALDPMVPGMFSKDPAKSVESSFTGVVLQLPKETKAKPVYDVVNELGEVLYQGKDLAEESFRKQLMGRWLIEPGTNELSRAVGGNPIRLSARENKNGQFVVTQSHWEKVSTDALPLLGQGRVVLSVR